MPAITAHQSTQTTKLLLIGDSGCLAGDTLLSVTRGSSAGKKFTLKQLYKIYHKPHHNVSRSLHTYLLSDVGGYVESTKMDRIVFSGIKPVFQIIAGRYSIRATADHQFKTPNGWARLCELKPGDAVTVWRSKRDKTITRRQLMPPSSANRAVVYSIPYHPFGQANFVAGRDYKRLPKARLVIEASMNGMSIDELIRILRSEPERAATLSYLGHGVEVHHLDGDETNDTLENLQILSPDEHLDLHQEAKNRESKATHAMIIDSILPAGETETYDIMMPEPHHNFVAGGFVVHNSGKTGALASLAQAGYNLRILDLDNGLDVLKNYLTDPGSPYVKADPQIASRVNFVTLTDPIKNINGKLVVQSPSVWRKTMELLTEWKIKLPDGTEENLGKLSSWTSQDVIVIDSLSFLATAAMNHHLGMNGALLKDLTQNEARRAIGAGQNLLRDFLNLIFDSSIKCNVIVTAHITFVTDEGTAPRSVEGAAPSGAPQGYPAAIGRALSPHIPRYFNNMLIARASGPGRRRLYTDTQAVGTQIINAKSSAPMRVKPDYAIETGLAEYFKAVRGEPTP